MEGQNRIKKIIKNSIYSIVIIMIIAVIALIILKYNVEGEKNMPFKLSSVIIVSNAEGYEKNTESEYLWNKDILQNNDIYLNIEKNLNYNADEIIKDIRIDNINIVEAPQIGNIEFYRASGEDEKNLFIYSEEYKINNEITYIGDINTDLGNFKISNQGGSIVIRVVNNTGVTYISNEEEFEHNGKLLKKADIAYEDIKNKISFELTIDLESGVSFNTSILLDLPVGDISQEGSSTKEIKDMKDINVVFKREYK